jgi:hypothetical protein
MSGARERIGGVALDDALWPLARAAARALDEVQGEVTFEPVAWRRRPPLPDLPGAHGWRALAGYLLDERVSDGGDGQGGAPGRRTSALIGLLGTPIEHNWFSRAFADERVAAVTTAGWAYLSTADVSGYVAFQLAANATRLRVPSLRLHAETLGCMQDLCANKLEFTFKLRTGDLCPTCRAELERTLGQAGLSSVFSMLDRARELALDRSPTVFRSAALVEPARPHAAHPAAPRGAPLLPDRVDRSFPFPIACPFRAMQAASTYDAKWSTLLDVARLSVRYVAWALLAERTGQQPAVVRQRIGSGKPLSDGGWVEICQALLRDTGRKGPVSAALERLDPAVEARALRAAEALVARRNRTRGHGITEAEWDCRASYEEHLGDLEQVLALVEPLCALKLIKPIASERRGGVERFSASVMMGSHPVFPTEPFISAEPVDTDCLLHDPVTGSYLSLFPWVTLDRCAACKRDGVAVYDRHDAERGRVSLVEVATNHGSDRQDLLGPVLRALGPGPSAE